MNQFKLEILESISTVLVCVILNCNCSIEVWNIEVGCSFLLIVKKFSV